MLRALAQADEVAQKLAQAMQQAQDQPTTTQTDALPLRAVFGNNGMAAQSQVHQSSAQLHAA